LKRNDYPCEGKGKKVKESKKGKQDRNERESQKVGQGKMVEKCDQVERQQW